MLVEEDPNDLSFGFFAVIVNISFIYAGAFSGVTSDLY
ncbi:hypothetical protein RKD56_002504 [Priestia megaterium]|jgi:hypothetical protein